MHNAYRFKLRNCWYVERKKFYCRGMFLLSCVLFWWLQLKVIDPLYVLRVAWCLILALALFFRRLDSRFWIVAFSCSLFCISAWTCFVASFVVLLVLPTCFDCSISNYRKIKRLSQSISEPNGSLLKEFTNKGVQHFNGNMLHNHNMCNISLASQTPPTHKVII